MSGSSPFFTRERSTISVLGKRSINILDELDIFENREDANSSAVGVAGYGGVGSTATSALVIASACNPDSTTESQIKKPCHFQAEKTNLPLGVITMFKSAQHV